MKRTTVILVCTLAAGMAWAQSPQIIQNTRAQMNTVQQNNTAASNEALGIKPAPAKSSAKPASTPPSKPSVVAVNSTASSSKRSVISAKRAASPSKPSVVPAKANAASPKA